MKWTEQLISLFKKKPLYKEETKEEIKAPPNSVKLRINTPKPKTDIIKSGAGISKLDNSQRSEVAVLIAHYYTDSEVIEYLMENHKVTINSSSVQSYRKSQKWATLITAERQKFLADISDIPGSHQKVRLRRADRIYQKAIVKDDFKAALSATEHQRRETDEKSGARIDLTLNQFNMMSDEDIQHRREELLDFIQHQKNKEIIDVKESTED